MTLRAVHGDTHDDVRRLMSRRLQTMTPSEKAIVVTQLSRATEAMAAAGIRQRHPDADEYEVTMRLRALHIEPTLLREAFGWSATQADG